MADASYDITRLAFLLADLPVVLLGRLRSKLSSRDEKCSAGPRPPALHGFQAEVAQVALAAVGERRMSRVDQEPGQDPRGRCGRMLLRYGRS